MQKQNEDEALKAAMAVLRSRRKPESILAAAEKGAAARRGKPLPEEQKAKLREAQATRRERERQEREAQGLVEPAQPPRPRGRPKKPTV